MATTNDKIAELFFYILNNDATAAVEAMNAMTAEEFADAHFMFQKAHSSIHTYMEVIVGKLGEEMTYLQQKYNRTFPPN